MNRAQRKLKAKFLAAESAKWPRELREVPREEWPDFSRTLPIRIWRSCYFFVQAFAESTEAELRLSVLRTVIEPDGNWRPGISWDELQEIKRQAGYGDRFAVEIFPADADVVNVSNIRHLWILREPLKAGWRR